jgi:hypothetical protein
MPIRSPLQCREAARRAFMSALSVGGAYIPGGFIPLAP